MRRPTCAVALVAALAALPAGASYRAPIRIDMSAQRARLAEVCADPAAAACAAALLSAAPSAAAALTRLAEHHDLRAAGLAVRAADSGFPEMRVAAANALSLLWADAPNDAVAAELLDDPVPAVRAAARRALSGSSDERSRRLAHRADRFSSGDQKSLVPEPVPSAAGLGVPLPADAVFLRFASDVAGGRYAFLTREAPAALGGRLAKAGRGPIAPEAFRETLEPEETGAEEIPENDSGSEMPSAEQMQAAMAMAAKAMGALNEHPNATPEEQARLMAKALGHAQVDVNLGDVYADSEAFGNAQLYVVTLANGLDAVVAVYRDLALGSTGIGVHLK